MMKVCFLVSNLISGGVERTVCYVSKYFAYHDIDTTILSLSDEIFYDVDEKVKLISLHIKRGYDNKFQKYERVLRRLYGVRKHIKKGKYDVVFCMAPEMTRYILPLHNKGSFKLISSERNNPLFDNENDKKVKEKAFPKCDGIIFQTQRAMECFPKEVQAKGVIIPNAVGNDLAYTVQRNKDTKRKITAVGRLTKQKDYFTLLKAFIIIHKAFPYERLEIYGSGEDEKELKEFCKSEGLSDCVFFLGNKKEALKLIADSDCFVLSSIYEGMPNVLMEAMAIGLPCVSTDCPFGPRELIKDGVNGFLVPVGDADKLAQKIIYILNNTDEAEQMGERAKHILEEQNINTIASQYLKYVQTIVGEKKDSE